MSALSTALGAGDASAGTGTNAGSVADASFDGIGAAASGSAAGAPMQADHDPATTLALGEGDTVHGPGGGVSLGLGFSEAIVATDHGTSEVSLSFSFAEAGELASKAMGHAMHEIDKALGAIIGDIAHLFSSNHGHAGAEATGIAIGSGGAGSAGASAGGDGGVFDAGGHAAADAPPHGGVPTGDVAEGLGLSFSEAGVVSDRALAAFNGAFVSALEHLLPRLEADIGGGPHGHGDGLGGLGWQADGAHGAGVWFGGPG